MILHITDRAAWQAAQAGGWFKPASLIDEGFIHCSTAAQLVATADRFYLGRTGLVVLVIDEAQVMSPLRYEAPVGPNEDKDARFPHLYGPLPVSAVLRVVELTARDDGTFAMPAIS